MRRLVTVLLAILLLALPAPALAAIGDEDAGDNGGSVYGYVEDAVIVSFRDGFPAASARRSFADEHRLAEVAFTPLSQVFRYRITDGRNPDQVAAALKNEPGGRSSHEDRLGPT